ncbi:MAG: DNA repair protein RecN [Waddliaceae bacterium]|nr:DNA repair protein RecN [Waddliaceae bacterium]
MLQHLYIENVILIEEATIDFSQGFNVLTGESGAGKSAVLQALELILGRRADAHLIRKGSQHAVVEASFDLSSQSEIIHFLTRSGVPQDASDPLLIRRELYNNGKNRIFINHRLVQLHLLRQLAEHLVDFAGQHAHQKLFDPDFQRAVLDSFGQHEELLKSLAKEWKQLKTLQQKLQKLLKQAATQKEETERCLSDIEEIEDAQLKENEDETLFAEYSSLSHAEELQEIISHVQDLFQDREDSALAMLRRGRGSLDKIQQYDPSFSEALHCFQESIVNLEEVLFALQERKSKAHHDPNRMEYLNSRLTLISQLKRKYGEDIPSILESLKKRKNELEKLDNLDMEIEDLQKELAISDQKCSHLCEELTEKRKENAQKLAQAIVPPLRKLKMPRVEFRAQLKKQNRNEYGDEYIEFLMKPNLGEKMVPVRDCASGGELSRLMLVIKHLLAGMDKTPTLVFDEIDANLGGETASVVAQKLQHLSQSHQVICITHLAQVAQAAEHHLAIIKEEQGQRTFTRIHLLEVDQRQAEIARMLGGRDFSEATWDLAKEVLSKSFP